MIEARDLTMHYGSVVALRQASFEVKKGEVVGLLGPNGAGKSTTMKILTTFLHPTAGTAVIGGHSILENPIAVRRLIGYLPEVLPLYMNMEVAEYLDFVGRARGLAGSQLKSRTDWVLDHCGLRPMYRRTIRELSKGYKQRTGIAQALIHDPDVVILDEPTSGLDPHQILEIRSLIRNLASIKTVILSTHILQEAEAMADRIIIINRGNIVGQGTLGELRDQAHETSRVRVAVVVASASEAASAFASLDGVQECRATGETGGVASFTLVCRKADETVRKAGELAIKKNWPLAQLTTAPYSLEETFLALTESDASATKKVQGGAA